MDYLKMILYVHLKLIIALKIKFLFLPELHVRVYQRQAIVFRHLMEHQKQFVTP